MSPPPSEPNGRREPVILAAVRTPIGRGHRDKGCYRNVHANELLGPCLEEVIARAGIEAERVGDVLTGCVQQYGEHSWNIGRNAWLQAGLPKETPGTTLDRQCGSGQQAVNFAAALVTAGVHDVVIGCGVEHMGHVPLNVGWSWEEEVGNPWPEALRGRYDLVPQGISAELIAEQWDASRSDLDEIALRSHRNAAEATRSGRFDREIVAIEAAAGDSFTLVTTDQGIRADTTQEALANLAPAFQENGKVTAGNSSQISDGAAAVLVSSAQTATELGLAPLAKIIDQVVVGVDPVTMLTGPVPVTRTLLERNGLTVDDLDVIEVNEAFASVVAMWLREFGADIERVNPNGGAIALGHPLGATGARLIGTAVHELHRADKELALVTMCCGGGLGTGTLIQRL